MALAQAAYAALALKVIKSIGIDEALKDIRQGKIGAVPNHLKDSHYPGAKNLGHGQGYIYPHDNPNVQQTYLPKELLGKKYYRGNK